MKKFGLLVAFSLLATAMVFSTNLTVQGTVAQRLSVAFSGTSVDAGAVALAVDNTGAAVRLESSAALKITLISSQKNWSVSFTGAGVLSPPVGSGISTTIPYNIRVVTTGVTQVGTNNLENYVALSATPLTITSTSNGGKTPLAGVDMPLHIEIPTYTQIIETNNTTTAYTDTITVTITAT